METKISENFLTKVLDKWGDKWWFKTLFTIAVVWILVGPLATTFINNSLQQKQVTDAVTSSLDDREERDKATHRANFEASRQSYALAKHKMQEYLQETGSEYIFLVEYHNGSENVMTGIQFCRFDITLEAVDDKSTYIQIEKFRDDIVARYDILLSEDLGKNKLLYYTQQEFVKADRYLAQQMDYINAKSYALLNLKDVHSRAFGSILCVSTDNEQLDLLAVRELAVDLENIFNNSLVEE